MVFASIFKGYTFLSEQRGYTVGMGGGSALPITITEMDVYYEVFRPLVTKEHFMRVVRAADRIYLEVSAEEQKRKSKSKDTSAPPTPTGGNSPSGNTFPPVPVKQG
mgnify:CR=1 FL=1